IKISHAIVDHEGGVARFEVFCRIRKWRPHRIRFVSRIVQLLPLEHDGANSAFRQTQMFLIPGLQFLWVLGLEEDAADSSYSFHDVPLVINELVRPWLRRTGAVELLYIGE